MEHSTHTDGSGDGQIPTSPPGGLVSDLLPDMSPSESASARGIPTDAGAAEACAQAQQVMAGHGRSTENADRTTVTPIPMPSRSALSFERFCQINNCTVNFSARQSDDEPWVGCLLWKVSGSEDEEITGASPREVKDFIVAYLLRTDYSEPSGRIAETESDRQREREWVLLGATAPLLAPGFIDEPKAEVPFVGSYPGLKPYDRDNSHQ